MLRFILFGVVVLHLAIAQTVPSSSAAEFDWPGWLGPNRDGRVHGFTLPKSWPEKLNRRWQIDVGTGYGSPLVVADRVYQHARQGEDEVLLCVDLETGQVKWRKNYPVPFKMGGGGERHGKGPKSSPVFADGRIFTMSITGTLSAWDADTGDRLWQRNYDDQFGKSQPYWGASTSPIVDDSRVIAHFGTDEKGALVALDVESGNEVWSQGKDGTSYSSPLLVEIDGVRQVVQWNHRALVGVESESGRLLWEYPFPHTGTNQNMPTPAINNGYILVGGENRGIRSVQPKRSGDDWSVTQRWRQEKVALDMASAVVAGDLLFGFSHYGAGRLFSLDTATGEILWQGPGRSGQNVTFLVIPGHIVALMNNGQMQIIRASGAAYEVVASYQVSENQTWAPPILLPDSVLIKDHDKLTRWSLQ